MPKFCFATISKPSLFLKSEHHYLFSERPSRSFSMLFHAHIEIYSTVCRFYLNLTILYALFCHLLLFLNNMSWGSFYNFKCW